MIVRTAGPEARMGKFKHERKRLLIIYQLLIVFNN